MLIQYPWLYLSFLSFLVRTSIQFGFQTDGMRIRRESTRPCTKRQTSHSARKLRKLKYCLVVSFFSCSRWALKIPHYSDPIRERQNYQGAACNRDGAETRMGQQGADKKHADAKERSRRHQKDQRQVKLSVNERNLKKVISSLLIW